MYDDLISKEVRKINLVVKKLWNPWNRLVSKTNGRTDLNGNTIVTYTWWLSHENIDDLVTQYAIHIGHEIFHTHYFKYVHDPGYNTKDFVNDRDVTYKIDDILEELVRKNQL